MLHMSLNPRLEKRRMKKVENLAAQTDYERLTYVPRMIKYLCNFFPPRFTAMKFLFAMLLS